MTSFGDQPSHQPTVEDLQNEILFLQNKADRAAARATANENELTSKVIGLILERDELIDKLDMAEIKLSNRARSEGAEYRDRLAAMTQSLDHTNSTVSVGYRKLLKNHDVVKDGLIKMNQEILDFKSGLDEWSHRFKSDLNALNDRFKSETDVLNARTRTISYDAGVLGKDTDTLREAHEDFEILLRKQGVWREHDPEKEEGIQDIDDDAASDISLEADDPRFWKPFDCHSIQPVGRRVRPIQGSIKGEPPTKPPLRRGTFLFPVPEPGNSGGFGPAPLPESTPATAPGSLEIQATSRKPSASGAPVSVLPPTAKPSVFGHGGAASSQPAKQAPPPEGELPAFAGGSDNDSQSAKPAVISQPSVQSPSQTAPPKPEKPLSARESQYEGLFQGINKKRK